MSGGVERRSGEVEHEPINPVRIGGVRTSEGQFWVMSDMERNISLVTVEDADAADFRRWEMEESVLDLSEIPHVDFYQIGTDPLQSRILEGDMGEPRVHLVQWVAEHLEDDQPARNLSLTPQRIAHLILNSEGGLDMSELFSMFSREEGAGIHYGVIELLPYQEDPMVWHDVRDMSQIEAARVFFIHPKAEAVREGLNYFSSKTALAALWRDLRHEVVDEVSDEGIDRLLTEIELVIENGWVQFTDGEGGLLQNHDLTLAQEQYRTHVVVAYLMEGINEHYAREYARVWPFGRLFAKRSLGERLWNRVAGTDNATLEYGVRDHQNLFLMRKTAEVVGSEEVAGSFERQEQGGRREDLLDIFNNRLTTVERPLDEPGVGWRKWLYRNSSIYERVRQRETITTQVPRWDMRDKLNPEDIERMSGNMMLQQAGGRLMEGVRLLRNTHVAGVSKPVHYDSAWRNLQSLALLSDKLVHTLDMVQITGHLPEIDLSDSRLRSLLGAQFYSADHLSDVVDHLSKITNLREEPDYKAWVTWLTSIVMNKWRPLKGEMRTGRNTVIIRSVRGNYLKKSSLGRLWLIVEDPGKARSLGMEFNRGNQQVAFILKEMLEHLYTKKHAEQLNPEEIDHSQAYVIDVMLYQFIKFGLLSEYTRLAEAGADNRDFHDWADFMHNVSMQLLGYLREGD